MGDFLYSSFWSHIGTVGLFCGPTFYTQGILFSICLQKVVYAKQKHPGYKKVQGR